MKTTNEKVLDLLEATNTNWQVRKLPLFAQENGNTLESKSFGIFKGDTHLGTVKQLYTPMQNYELATTIIEAASRIGLEVDKGGALFNGKKIYYQVALPKVFIGKDNMNRYITCTNSHDGSTSIGFGSSNTVIGCKNSFFRAYRQVNKFRHTESAKERIELAVKDLGETLKLDEALIKRFKLMAQVELKDEMIERVINKIFKINDLDKEMNISTRKSNQIKDFMGGLNTEIQAQGKTAWGLFNGVTRYTNHIQYTEPEKVQNSIMAGEGYKLSNMSFDDIMEYIEQNEAELVEVLR